MKQKLLILLTTLMAAVSAHGYDFKVNNIYYNILSLTEVEVTKGDYTYEVSINIYCCPIKIDKGKNIWLGC